MRPILASFLILAAGLVTATFAQQAAPQISGVSPTTARAGDQVVINGSNFGSSQGSGNVWLGSVYGVVVSWSDSQVVAAVASGSQSGVAQILQGGVWSNPVNFTVITPNIASVTPATAIAGT
ncbi:MAG TPA: IPT/TIG domain-containing protein [Candidatus Acidoferrum sp.]